jgi:hypothetical protein
VIHDAHDQLVGGGGPVFDDVLAQQGRSGVEAFGGQSAGPGFAAGDGGGDQVAQDGPLR